MNILLTNDDGYRAKGLSALAEAMAPLGTVSVVAPKHHESGMAMAVSLGLKQLVYKDLGERDGVRWAYLDATPASCVKYGINFVRPAPEIVVSGINHGSNAGTAACYSATLGAAQEAAVNGLPAIGVSLDDVHADADFSEVIRLFPEIFRALVAAANGRYGVFYNVNFPRGRAKGIRVCRMGRGRWIREFVDWDPAYYLQLGLTPEMLGQPSTPEVALDERLYMMAGQYEDGAVNPPDADHHRLAEGFITITAHNIVTTDFHELARLRGLGFEQDF